MPSSPAARCATRPGGAASPWRKISPGQTGAWPSARWRRLYRAGKIPALITQNIDNLHQASGIAAEASRRIAWQYHLCDLPGLRRALRAGLGEGAIEPSGQHAPDCPCCGGLHQDRDDLIRSGHAGRGDAARRRVDARLRSVSGRSARRWWCGLRRDFRSMAKRNGAALVIINREPTEFDDLADLVVHNDIGDALGPSSPTDSDSRCAVYRRCAQAHFAFSSFTRAPVLSSIRRDSLKRPEEAPAKRRRAASWRRTGLSREVPGANRPSGSG